MRILVLIIFIINVTGSFAYCDGSGSINQPALGENTPASRLNKLREALPDFSKRIERLKADGQDVSYPLVSYTVLENFIGYAEDDMNNGELSWATTQISDLESIGSSLDKELSSALSGKSRLPSVPKWTGDKRPVIKGSSFFAPTVTFGKRTRDSRPVFFIGYGHFNQVRRDIEKFPYYGTNMIQIEVGPWNVFPEENKVSKAAIDDIAAILDRAQKAGVGVNLLISPHYIPQWLVDRIKHNKPGFHGYCPRAPESQEMLKRYISTIIPPIKDHPALHSICLSNEPGFGGDTCEYTLRDWRIWLKSKHGSIDVLNDRWSTKYKDFDDVSLPNFGAADEKLPIGRWVDYVRFNQESHIAWQKMLADAVHAVAPNLAVHSKVLVPTFVDSSKVAFGNDAYLFGGITDINGNDSTNTYTFGDGFVGQHWLENSIGYDLQRSVNDAPIFNSENHLIYDRETRYVPAEHIRAALWQQAIHGQSATTIWVWERTFDRKSDFYGSIMERPACARAVGIVNYDLNRAAKEITALQQAPAQAIILYSTSAMVYDGDNYDACLNKLYLALDMCGVNIRFVTERQLERGVVPNTPVIFVPNITHLSDAAFHNLDKYRGSIVNVGSRKLLNYNEYDKPRFKQIAEDQIPYETNKTTAHDIAKSIFSKSFARYLHPQVELVDSECNPIWGVEWRCVHTSNGLVVDICNYLNAPISIKLFRKGMSLNAVDVLTQQPVSGVFVLKPLEIKLLRVNTKIQE